jgi:hypothetical protein
VLDRGQWKVAQYNLSVPIPNDLVLDVAAQIRGENIPDAAAPTATDDAADDGSTPSQEPQAAPCRKKRHKTNRAASC